MVITDQNSQAGYDVTGFTVDRFSWPGTKGMEINLMTHKYNAIFILYPYATYLKTLFVQLISNICQPCESLAAVYCLLLALR